MAAAGRRESRGGSSWPRCIEWRLDSNSCVIATVRRQGCDARPSPGAGGAGEGGEERPACPQQPAGEQGDAAGGRPLPDVSRALRQAVAGQRSPENNHDNS